MTLPLLLGCFVVLLVVLVPVALSQHKNANLGRTSVATVGAAQPNLASAPLPTPYAPPALTSFAPRPVTPGAIAMGVWMGLWLFAISAGIPILIIAHRIANR